MRIAKMSLISVISLLAMVSAALAADYYVDVNTGDDWNYGLSPDNAWKTITHAVAAAGGGTPQNVCTIHVAPGTYCRDSGEQFPIYMTNDYVHLLGADPETTVVDAEHESATIWPNASYVTIEGLAITGGDTLDWNRQGCGLNAGADDLTIRNCRFYGNRNEYWFGGAICVSGENVLIENNEIFDNYDNTMNIEGSGTDGAIYVMGGSCIIRSNYIHDNNCAAVNTFEGYPRRVIVLRDNVMENNVRVQPPFHEEDYSLIGLFELVENCRMSGSCSFIECPSGTRIKNCLFTGLYGVSYVGWSEPLPARTASFELCTFASAASPLVGISGGHGKFENCVFYGNGTSISLDKYIGWGTAEVSYSCISDPEWASLPTNFDADPLFVTGPLGDYYLSQTAAGQAEAARALTPGR